MQLPSAAAAVGGETVDAIADPKRQLAYLLQPLDDRIEVLSLSTMHVTQSVPLPASPGDFDITPGGDSLVVTLEGAGALGIIDLRQAPLTVSLLPLQPVDSTGAPRPVFVRTLSNGKAFVSLSGSGLLDEVDLATGAQRVRRDAGNNGNVGVALLGRSLDHSAVVLFHVGANLQRYDVSTDQFGTPVATTVMAPVTPALDSTGTYVAVETTIYDRSLQVVRAATSPFESPLASVLSADGDTLDEVTPYGDIVRARVNDGSIIDRIKSPIGAVDGKSRISDDGTLLMTTQGAGIAGSANDVGVIHLH